MAAASGLTMAGLVGILDPPRPEAIEACSIVVKMITGDHPGTATAVARMLGIVPAAAPRDTFP
ncbi:hypothetical protein T484DRAFT_1792893, partial [Baffinella frigidus]